MTIERIRAEWGVLLFWYLFWVVVNTVGGPVGFAVGRAFGTVTGRILGIPGSYAAARNIETVQMVVGFAVAFAVIGTLQWLVLQAVFQVGSWRWWVLSNIVGLSMGFAVPADEVVFIIVGERALADTAGFAVIGVIIGVIQWLILRQKVSWAGWWVLANAAGWGLGLTVALPVAEDVNVFVGTGVVGVRVTAFSN